MNIVDATQSYEAWLRDQVTIHEPDLAYKHQQMSRRDDPFPFFRGTYYRWLQHWPTYGDPQTDTPNVLAVGDAHIENFGTWRDAEGRLVWGINDFDETAELPYTNDLVRLAASVWMARRSGSVQLGFRSACKAIRHGYQAGLARSGEPFVLEERHRHLRRLATATERAPIRFWRKLTGILRTDEAVEPPSDVVSAFLPTWPHGEFKWHYRFRTQVGVGSLGKPRYLGLSKWKGSWIAREAKALTPPANAWVTGQSVPTRITELLQSAVRCRDPFYHTNGTWIIRRMAARCSRIDLEQLQAVEDEAELFTAMGAEIANMHLGTPNAAEPILADLAQRPRRWLVDAAKRMAKAIRNDWRDWRKR